MATVPAKAPVETASSMLPSATSIFARRIGSARRASVEKRKNKKEKILAGFLPATTLVINHDNKRVITSTTAEISRSVAARALTESSRYIATPADALGARVRALAARRNSGGTLAVCRAPRRSSAARSRHAADVIGEASQAQAR